MKILITILFILVTLIFLGSIIHLYFTLKGEDPVKANKATKIAKVFYCGFLAISIFFILVILGII